MALVEDDRGGRRAALTAGRMHSVGSDRHARGGARPLWRCRLSRGLYRTSRALGRSPRNRLAAANRNTGISCRPPIAAATHPTTRSRWAPLSIPRPTAFLFVARSTGSLIGGQPALKERRRVRRTTVGSKICRPRFAIRRTIHGAVAQRAVAMSKHAPEGYRRELRVSDGRHKEPTTDCRRNRA